ncbi:hypothetical protein MN116_004432 [Schistosoma mekongi]|uniref:Uncharacterized protein n=1 Tax=Schistosoma mekongi TaxID=38744 RepID=A0AAE2D6R6_SCHME|nr:hypothetical protein MN116_004432 [Schistosoma mekongi]
MVNCLQCHHHHHHHHQQEPQWSKQMKFANCIHHHCNTLNNMIVSNKLNHSVKCNYCQENEINEIDNHMTIGYDDYCKCINNAKLIKKKPINMIMINQNVQKIMMPLKQSNTSTIGNQSESYISQKMTSENEITDCETPTTEFTESSKSQQSTSQIHVYRKGRSLSPADIISSKEMKLSLCNSKPRFSLIESNEMNNKPVENNQSFGLSNIIVDRGSQESAVSYPVQDTYSQLNINKNLDNSVENRTCQSLMSVYLNDVVQQNKSISQTTTLNTRMTTATNNINCTTNENNSSSVHSIYMNNGNSNNNNEVVSCTLNIPKIETSIFNNETYPLKRMNSYDSSQSRLSLHTDIYNEQNNPVNYEVQSSMSKEKSKRPVLCLFSANKSQKRYLKRDNSIRNDNDDDNVANGYDYSDSDYDDIGQRKNDADAKQNVDTRRLSKGINISTTKLPVINQIKRTIASSNNINSNDNNCNHNLNLLCNTDECRSCMNLQTYELSQDRYRNPSSGSTVSRIPRSDLPDVYLNPPSMSTLQSQRSSLCGRSRMELLYIDNELGRINSSKCKLNTNELMNASNIENLSNMIESNHHFSEQHTNRDGDNWSLVDELIILPKSQTPGLLRHQILNVRNTYHQPRSSSNLALPLFKPYQLTDDNFGNLPVKDKEHHIGIQHQLKQALNLSYRRKSRRSLNAEIQSIMDKHYEMTGIRMTIGTGTSRKNSTTTKSYMNLFGLPTVSKIQSSYSKKRRCSWTFTKDITNEFQSSLKKVSSALHLDCTNFDLLQKLKHNRERPSVLESLSMTALPCLLPLRPRILSDATNDVTMKNEESIGRQYRSKFHSDLHNIKLIDFKRNSSMIGIDKNLTKLSIQRNIRLVKSNWNLTNL